MTTPDRLTEIRARVASFRRDGLGYSGTSMADLEYALGEIERLESQRGTLIGEGNCVEPMKWSPLGEQIVRLEAERERLRAALQGLYDDRYGENDAASQFARAVLEESK